MRSVLYLHAYIRMYKHTDNLLLLLSLGTSLSIIPSLMMQIRLFPLINMFLTERLFVCAEFHGG